jgi:hypothetical protein
MDQEIKIKESDLHPHIRARMLQRGISIKEIEETLSRGWDAADAVEGTTGKVAVFTYNAEWEGNFFEEKEVTVYYKYKGEQFILLSAKARYGKNFKKGEKNEN